MRVGVGGKGRRGRGGRQGQLDMRVGVGRGRDTSDFPANLCIRWGVRGASHVDFPATSSLTSPQIQGYNFRLCLTQNASNMVPIAQARGEEEKWEGAPVRRHTG